MNITEIHLYDYGTAGFSADIAIDDSWIIQLGDDGQFSIPSSDERNWNDPEAQTAARNEHDADDVAKELRIPTTIGALREMGGEDML